MTANLYINAQHKSTAAHAEIFKQVMLAYELQLMFVSCLSLIVFLSRVYRKKKVLSNTVYLCTECIRRKWQEGQYHTGKRCVQQTRRNTLAPLKQSCCDMIRTNQRFIISMNGKHTCKPPHQQNNFNRSLSNLFWSHSRSKFLLNSENLHPTFNFTTEQH